MARGQHLSQDGDPAGNSLTLVTRLCARCYDTDDMVWPESALTPVTVDVETLYDTGDNAELMWLSVCHISTR